MSAAPDPPSARDHHDDADTVAVVIATHRRQPGPLPEVVHRFLAQAADQVVVVLDGPQPSSRAALDRLVDPRLEVVELTTNMGQATAKLRGVEAASARIVITADDDIIPHDGVVARQRRLHHGRDDLVVVGHIPVSDPGDGGPTVASRLFAREYESVVARWEREPETILEGMYGGLASLPRAMFLQAHRFKPTVRLEYFEDLDLGLRLRAVGGIGLFDRVTAGEHLHRKANDGLLGDAESRAEALPLLRQRWGSVPRYTRATEPRWHGSLRSALAHIDRLPYALEVLGAGLGVLLDAAGRIRWARGELVAARMLRSVVEQATSPDPGPPEAVRPLPSGSTGG